MIDQIKNTRFNLSKYSINIDLSLLNHVNFEQNEKTYKNYVVLI